MFVGSLRSNNGFKNNLDTPNPEPEKKIIIDTSISLALSLSHLTVEAPSFWRELHLLLLLQEE